MKCTHTRSMVVGDQMRVGILTHSMDKASVTEISGFSVIVYSK